MTVTQIRGDLSSLTVRSAKEALKMYFEPLTRAWLRRQRADFLKMLSNKTLVGLLISLAVLVSILVLVAAIVILCWGVVLAAGWALKKFDALPFADSEAAVLLAFSLVLAGGSMVAWIKKASLHLRGALGVISLGLVVLAIHISVHPLQAWLLALAGGLALLGLGVARVVKLLVSGN